MKRTQKIVKRVCIPETLRLIMTGESVTYACGELGPYQSVRCAVSRLNRLAGYMEYEIESATNGSTYTVTRNHMPRNGR